MKGNNGKGNIKERDIWETPQKLWNKLHKKYNFDLDCCANKNNTKLDDFSNNFLSFKATCLFKCAWMNPPFSKAEEMFKQFFKEVKKGVAIYRCDNLETKLWQEVIFPSATWIFIPNKRIAYEGMEGKGSRFPSALIGFKVPIPKGLDGTILKCNKDV